MTIRIENLRKGSIGYKMSNFAVWSPYVNLTTAQDDKDWSGIYLAPDRSVAEGYGSDYLDATGAGSANMHRVLLLQDMKMVVCDDPKLGDGSMAEQDKTALVKAQLASDASIKLDARPLIPSLGRLGYVYKGYHDDEGNWEIIVPNRLSAFLSMLRTSTYRYKGFMLQGPA
jgi:hypothetical protein